MDCYDTTVPGNKIISQLRQCLQLMSTAPQKCCQARYTHVICRSDFLQLWSKFQAEPETLAWLQPEFCNDCLEANEVHWYFELVKWCSHMIWQPAVVCHLFACLWRKNACSNLKNYHKFKFVKVQSFCVKKEKEKRSVAVEIFCYFILIHTF